MRKTAFRYTLISVLAAGSFTLIGFASAATPAKYIASVPINTFCSTYAKDVATKSVAISLIVKIKDNLSLKASLMRQYATFISLGKQYCKDQYAPNMYDFGSTNQDISHNTPIVTPSTAVFMTPADYFTGYDTSAFSQLNSDQVTTTLSRIERAKDIYAQTINEFIGEGWLQPADRDNMVGKIAFRFSNNCTELDGQIFVRERFDSNKNPTITELLNMFITINLCFQQEYQDGYDTFLNKIIDHELGHYLDYLHDKNDADFRNLCWSGTASICGPANFITPYAASSPDEDYAETFAAYVQQDGYTGANSILQAKFDYFADKFPK